MNDDEVAYGTLLDWLEDRLPPDASAAVAERVRCGSAELRDTVEWLRGFLKFSQSHKLHDVPPVVRQSLQQAFRDRCRSGDAPAPRLVEPILLFDSRSHRELVGVRGSSLPRAHGVVHLAFTSPDADLLLDVTVRPAGDLDLTGQVLVPAGAESPVFEATVLAGGHISRSVDGDELGRFRFTRQPAPIVQLTTTNGDIALTVPLDIG